MKLHQLINTPGATNRRRRVGCGNGSGHGHTCGRGNKGMKARSGGSVRPGYEGGQMPLYRKLPHRGFSNYNFRHEYALVNVGDLGVITANEIDAAALAAAGLIRKAGMQVKILGTGALSRAITIKAHKFSASAREKITQAGGQAIELAPPPPPAAAEPPEKNAKA